MKKSLFLTLLAIVMACCTCCSPDIGGNPSTSSNENISEESGNGEQKDGYVLVTFIQENQEPIYKYVKKGEDLIDIPTPATIIGCSVEWDIYNFENIDEDLVVNAVVTKNDYYIYYNVGDSLGVTISENKTLVHYGEEYTLVEPKRSGYTFVGWKVEESGVQYTSGIFESTENVYLIAEWKAKGTEWINPFI